MAILDELMTEADKSRDELVELLQDIVRIPTVNTGVMPTGNETELCQFLKQKLDAEGIDSVVIGGEPARSNLVARLPGAEDGKAKLMFMSHTDVVPIGDESKWLHPPFSGKLHGGRVYGRGSNDCKGLTACEAMAMILLKRLKVPLGRSLILAAGADEEAGSKHGFRWLAAHERRRVSADFAINEGGGASFQTPGGSRCYTVALGEKGRLEAKISLTGRSCHASVPWSGDNALLKLSRAVQKISDYRPELDVSAPAFRELPRVFGVEEADITPENVDNLIRGISEEGSFIGSMLRGLSRMTVTPTMATGGIKSNVVPDEYRLICDIRVLPGQSVQYVKDELEEVLRDVEGCALEVRGTLAPDASPSDSGFLGAMRASLAKVLGTEVDVIQTQTVGLTDSWVIRTLGTIVYNFAPYHPDSDSGMNNVHGDNESISVEDLVFRTKVLAVLACGMLA